MTEKLLALLRDPKFWLAVIALVQIVAVTFYPGVPVDLFAKIGGAILAILGVNLGVNVVKAARDG